MVATLLLLAAHAAATAQSLPVAGRDYLVLDPPRPVATGGRIEVIEFFYYGCPVCYESQPHIAHWLTSAQADVLLVRISSATSEDGENFALTYYILETSCRLAQLHGPIYENYHFDDQRLNDEKSCLNGSRATASMPRCFAGCAIRARTGHASWRDAKSTRATTCAPCQPSRWTEDS